jgi:TatD DNase family protein
MQLIDSHCHLDFSEFDSDRNAILAQCQHLNIHHILLPAVTRETWSKLIATCKQYPQLHPTLGLHPMFMDKHQAEDIAALNQAVIRHNPIAIGEIGLDFYLPDHNKPAQKTLFKQQLEIAQTHKLPVLLHIRKAHDDALKLLRETRVSGGIVHAFNGSLQQAENYIKLGFLFGIGGAITHPRATKLRQRVKDLPLSSLALETDSPDMPLFERPGRNSPTYLPEILSCLAELRNESIGRIAQVTTHNVQHLWKEDSPLID